ncbi:MAG: Hsp20/alpha crystallin family protein [Chitinophagaceae bacterium]|nr:Hsp20/alpha crystallin family protein [Chitinophagaceae bacterium]
MIQVKHPLNRNLNVVFDEIFNALPQSWGRDFKEPSYVAPTNIHESAAGYHLELLVPGRNKEDFKVNIDKKILTISFEKQVETENKDYQTIKREFTFNSFKRSFNLDEKINAEAIQAKYENGVLKFFLPKVEEVKVAPKQITIQ